MREVTYKELVDALKEHNLHIVYDRCTTVDFGDYIVESYVKDRKIIAKIVRQEYFDEVASYYWSDRYYII